MSSDLSAGAPLRMAHSPCPNDTFVFDAWTHGRVAGAPPLQVTFADIDVTNNWLEPGTPGGQAGQIEHDVMKISYGALPHALRAGWQLVHSGGALGRGCGPLLLTREGADAAADEPDADRLRGRTIAVPSQRSTAYLLLELWARPRVPAPGYSVVVMPFETIMPAVAAGEVDAGLVIHEARFTYPSYGLTAMVDLGEWWESATGLPIPLGAIVARAGLDPEAVAGWARRSVELAWADPGASADYVRQHAQEMDPGVQQQHIELYVNEFTRDLGTQGLDAVRGLLERAAELGLVPDAEL